MADIAQYEVIKHMINNSARPVTVWWDTVTGKIAAYINELNAGREGEQAKVDAGEWGVASGTIPMKKYIELRRSNIKRNVSSNQFELIGPANHLDIDPRT